MVTEVQDRTLNGQVTVLRFREDTLDMGSLHKKLVQKGFYEDKLDLTQLDGLDTPKSAASGSGGGSSTP
jgi:hypothetical protein